MNYRVELEGKFPCEMRFGSFRPGKWNFRVHLDPNFLVRDSHAEISVNLECVLLVVRERFKNGTIVTFHDMCGVSGSKNDQLFISVFGMNVSICVKAKQEAFRESKSLKWEMYFCSI